MSCAQKVFGNKCGALFGWQMCVLLSCTGGTILSYKAKYYGDTLPLLNLASSYFLVFICNVWWWPKANTKWWGYILVAVTIVSGDCLNLLAYNKTSMASVMLIITTVIFWVAPLSYLVFKRTINWKQFLAMLLAAGGVSMVMVAQGTKDSRLIGNLLALAASLIFAIVNITQEKVVKDDSIRLYLCRFSCLTFPMAAALSGSLEWKKIRDYKWEPLSIALQILYPITLAAYYMFSPFVLQYSDATVMNLSFLTSNFYSLAIDILLFGRPFDWLYIVGFLCIPVAVAIFVLCETKQPKENAGTITEELIAAPHMSDLPSEEKL